ncbi:MAG: DUF3943 domain-containing protein [Chrysiogenia bacterium]
MKNKKLQFLLIFFMVFGLWAAENKADIQSKEEAKPAKKVGRAFIEMGINMAVSTLNYWDKYAKFIEDWQFTLTWKDQKRKFFTSEGLRLDSNNLRLNWTHAWSGALYYNWARSNQLSPLASSLFAFGGSLIWEYFAEFREVASINDTIFTAIGGPAIGEPLFQIADHFRSRPGLANRVACLLIDPVLGINDFIDGNNRGPRLPTREWRDFRFSLGGKRGPASPADNNSGHAALDLDLRLVTLPGYGHAGSGSGYSRQPIDNEYRISCSFNGRLFEELSARTRCALSGWWWKDVRADERGELHGAEFWLGPVMGWDFFQKKPIVPYDGNDLGMIDPWLEREQPTRYTDKHSTVNLIGPAFNLTRYAGRLTARFDLEATLDFGMVNSLAYNDYSADHDVWGVKTTLHNWGYYYSLGYSLGGRFDLRYRGLRAEAGIQYQRFASIQGLDRFQDDLLDDSRLSDSRLVYNAGLSVAIPRTPLFLSLNLEGIDRRGRFHEVSVKNHELRFFYQLGIIF